MKPFFNGNNKVSLFCLKLQISVEKALQFYFPVTFYIINETFSPKSMNLTFCSTMFPCFSSKTVRKVRLNTTKTENETVC
jgi:hypothetical protein